ncbi:MAG: nuclear transport factor 2 family protein [Luteolibacter sp.]
MGRSFLADYDRSVPEGHDFWDDFVASKLGSTEWMVHVVTNHLIEFERETLALSEAIVTSYQKLKQSDEVQLFCGRYVDRVESRDGVWKIARRQMVEDFSGSFSVGEWEVASSQIRPMLRGGFGTVDVVTGPARDDLMRSP